jgi:hypothetical protein
LLESLRFGGELSGIARTRPPPEFHFGNGRSSGRREFLYQLIRWKKPRRIIEIGRAIRRSWRRGAAERGGGSRFPVPACSIEPYEVPGWNRRASK